MEKARGWKGSGLQPGRIRPRLGGGRVTVGSSWDNESAVLRAKKRRVSRKIRKGSLVTLPTTDLVGLVTVCRGQIVQVKWPDDTIRLHQRRFLIKVEPQKDLFLPGANLR